MKNEYPSSKQLKYIEEYNPKGKGWKELVDFIEGIWWMGYGWKIYEKKDEYKSVDDLDSVPYCHKYKVLFMSTGGWSGNESIIEALQKNKLFWYHWISEQRGGHYEFEFKMYQEDW